MAGASPRALESGVNHSAFANGRNLLWATLALALLAGLLRLAVMEELFPPQLLGDESYYAEVAASIGRGEGHRYPEQSGTTTRAYRPPAHAFLLSLVLRGVESPVAPDQLHGALLLQVAISTLLVIVTVLLGRELFDARVGLLAGAAAAVYPNFVAHAHYLWSESLFATLVTGALWLTVANQRRRRGWMAALAGLLFGLAALTRETAIPIAIVAGGWSWWVAPRGIRRAATRQSALLLACAALTVVPWTLRNHEVLGRWVPVATVGWFAAAEGNAMEGFRQRAGGPRWWKFKVAYLQTQGEMERTDFARDRTLAMIREDQPSWIFQKLFRNTLLLFAPDATLFYKIRGGSYGTPPRSVLAFLLVANTLLYTLIIVGGVLGVAQARGSGRCALACAIFATVIALHALVNSVARFRMPWMPILMIYASYFALHWRSARWRPPTPRVWVSAVLLLFYLGVCLPSFSEPAANMWKRASAATAASG